MGAAGGAYRMRGSRPSRLPDTGRDRARSPANTDRILWPVHLFQGSSRAAEGYAAAFAGQLRLTDEHRPADHSWRRGQTRGALLAAWCKSGVPAGGVSERVSVARREHGATCDARGALPTGGYRPLDAADRLGRNSVDLVGELAARHSGSIHARAPGHLLGHRWYGGEGRS